MTINKLVKSKETKKDELPEIPLELRKLITNAKKKKFNFPNAEETVKDVDLLYFLNKKSHVDMSLISSKFLTAGFALKYLKTLNEFIEKKYNIPKLTPMDFIDTDKMEQVRQRMAELEDEPIINWLIDECLEKLKDAIDKVDVDNIDKLAELGHIINLSEKELSFKDRNEDIEIYDVVYRYLNRLDDFELCGAKNDVAWEMTYLKRSSTGKTTEIRVECTGKTKVREQPKRFIMFMSQEFLD